jgi:serine/threonine protein kinase
MEVSTVPEVPGFTVGRELGSGGSSTVWLVTEERTGRDFALKCLLPEPAGDTQRGEATNAEAVRREIRILSVLDHPHLIKAHDALRLADGPAGSRGSGGGLGLLVDYAPGGSLGQLVSSRGKLSIGETVTVLTPIAQVLGYLHGKGFTHSDVSPGNVLFTGHGKPLLSDVGVARMLGDASTVPSHGTAGFMDPTPVDAVRAGLQPERDVYSAAALGWYCLTGEPPRRTADRPPLSLLLPEVPVELAAALESALNEDRRLRPTAVELATAIYRSASPLPVDLTGSVHATVIPELLTRRHVPARSKGAVREGLQAWGRRISTSRWSGLFGARQVLPFPQEEAPGTPRSTAPQPMRPARARPPQHGTAAEHAETAGSRHARGKHAGQSRAQDPPGLPGHGRHGGRRRVGRVGRVAAALAVIALAGAWWSTGPMAGPAGQGPAAVSPATVSTAAAVGGLPAPGRPDPVTPDPAAQNPVTTDPVKTDVEVPGNVDVPVNVRAQLGSADPAEAVHGLAWIRSLAFSSGRLELLVQVNAPGSAAAAADERISGPLRENGHILAGFTGTLSNVRTHGDSSATKAVVGVTSATSSYEEQDPSGTLVAEGPAAAGQELRLVVVPVDGKWRIAEILPGP